MTDDEKMLLVAKACGWTLVKSDLIVSDESRWWVPEIRCYFKAPGSIQVMAEIVAKLGLQIHANNMLGVAECSTKGVLFNDLKASRIPADGNIKAALCRAVFEVAAKIGETL